MKIILSIAAALLLLFAFTMGFLLIEANAKHKKCEAMLQEANAFSKKLQDEADRTQEAQKQLQKENDALKQESLEYLKRENEHSEKIKGYEDAIRTQEANLKEAKAHLEGMEKKMGELKARNAQLEDISDLAVNVQVAKQTQKIAGLEKSLAGTKDDLYKQEALLHYNLGTSYTKDKNYEMAIEEYEKVLKLSPDDPDTHYNLAIIYDEWRKNPKRAIEHYQKYLKLRPDAQDKDEVKEWISRLEK